MPKKALVLLAEGAEDPEVVNPVYVLRALGVEVTLAGVDGEKPVKTVQNISITPDCSIENILNNTYDAVIVPGGLKGSEIIQKNKLAGDILKRHFSEDKLIATICGGAKSLLENKIGLGRKITSYPYFRPELENHFDFRTDRVVQDGNIITSEGPGTSFDFAVKIAQYLEGEEKVQDIGSAYKHLYSVRFKLSLYNNGLKNRYLGF